jgi:hypothetical protein
MLLTSRSLLWFSVSRVQSVKHTECEGASDGSGASRRREPMNIASASSIYSTVSSLDDVSIHECSSYDLYGGYGAEANPSGTPPPPASSSQSRQTSTACAPSPPPSASSSSSSSACVVNPSPSSQVSSSSYVSSPAVERACYRLRSSGRVHRTWNQRYIAVTQQFSFADGELSMEVSGVASRDLSSLSLQLSLSLFNSLSLQLSLSLFNSLSLSLFNSLSLSSTLSLSLS